MPHAAMRCSWSVNSQLIMNKCTVTVSAAFMHVRDNIEELGKVANDTDLLFLKGLLDSPVVTSLVKVSAHFISKSKWTERSITQITLILFSLANRVFYTYRWIDVMWKALSEFIIYINLNFSKKRMCKIELWKRFIFFLFLIALYLSLSVL